MYLLNVKGKILFLATVDVHIYAFHIPFMKLLESMGYGVEVACSDTGFTERIEKEGFVVHKIPFSRNPLSLSNAGAFIILLHLLKANNYIMIHTHTPVASFLGRIAGRIVGVPCIIYTAHGFHFHEYGSKVKNFIYYRLEKFAGKFTDVLITINTDDFRFAKERFKQIKEIVYIKGVGVDTDKFSKANALPEVQKDYETKLGISSAKFKIIFIGEMIKRKNFKDVIEVVSILKESGCDFLLIAVGDGILITELKDFVKQKDLNDFVIFLGYRPDIPELLAFSDALVLTSIREGLSKAVMEAMAMEKPVVAYNIRGMRDLIVDGETGFLVPFRNVSALAEKISYLAENREIARKMGEKGRKRIEKEFSLGIISNQMKKLYNEILEE